MKLPVISTFLLIGAFALGAMAQTAGDKIKDAGTDTKNAAKDTGSAVKKTTKTAAKKVKGGTHKAAAKVADKTQSKPPSNL